MSDAAPHASPGDAPLLSVVVPFFDVEDYIDECLESLRGQVLDDIEVILVDDGSRDGTIGRAQAMVETDPRFRLVRQENQGLGPARNTGARHARGRYLMFVDSDDVVDPRGLWRMVDSLESTGSDIAAGNAKRFSRATGSYQSWAHSETFATSARAISIGERPELVRDRMIWNKMFRRSFWTAQNLEFPAIRYEDYPVTLAAYCRARSIDVIAEPVYFWRDRESGTSITQQVNELGNAEDRVTSALLALDVLDRDDALPDVRAVVDRYLERVDLVALAHAWHEAGPRERPRFAELTKRLAERLDLALTAGNPTLPRALHKALVDGDDDFAAALAAWRLSPSPRAFVRSTDLPRHPLLATKIAAVVLASRRPRDLRTARRLRSQVRSAQWHDGACTIEVMTTMRPQLARLATIWPTGSTQVRVESQHLESTGVRTVLSWRPDSTPRPASSVDQPLGMAARSGPLRWAGPITVPAPGWVHVEPQGAAYLDGPELTARQYPAAVLLTASAREGDDLVLTVDGLASEAIVVRRPAPAEDLVVPVSGGRARLSLTELRRDDPLDDIVQGTATRRVECADGPVLVVGAPEPVRTEHETLRLVQGPEGTAALVIERMPAADDES